MKILIFVKHLLKALLDLEGTDGAQALERRRKVGEHRTASLKEIHEHTISVSIQTSAYLLNTVFVLLTLQRHFLTQKKVLLYTEDSFEDWFHTFYSTVFYSTFESNTKVNLLSEFVLM